MNRFDLPPEVRRLERPDLHRAFNPWDRISEPDGLRQMLAETGTHPLNEPEDCWKIAMGGGYRGTLEQLAPDTFKRVRQGNLSRLFEEQVTSIETNVIYAIATKE